MLRTDTGPNKEATARTFRTRSRWFLAFLDQHKIVDQSLSSIPLLQRNHLFVMYALSLLRKDNIKVLTITTDTMDRYLHAAAAQVRDATIPLKKEYFDPRYDQYNRPAAAIAKVRQAHKRWEAMPSRRETDHDCYASRYADLVCKSKRAFPFSRSFRF